MRTYFVHNSKYFKKKKFLILALVVLFTSLLIINISGNNRYLTNNTDDKNEETLVDGLKPNDINYDNSFTGVGLPWNITHYANQTKTNLDVSFNNNSYDASQQIKLDSGWKGYQLNSTINNLYITNNLVNGTFNCGTFTGGSPPPSYDDSAYVANWTFGKYDVPAHTNVMMGNYFDATHSDSDGADSLQLRINRTPTTGWFDQGDKCWWTTSFAIPQGEIESGWISFDINPKYYDDYANHFEIRFIINNTIVWNAALLSLKNEIDSALGYVGWYNVEKNINNIKQIIPAGTTETNVTIELERIGTSQSNYNTDYGVVFDNVTLVVKEKAKPSEIDLKLNNNQINDDPVNDGAGFLGIIGNWNGDEQSSVIANFSSNYEWPLIFNDDGVLRSYKVELEANLALYINKTSPGSYYKADPDLNYQGSDFILSNNSNVNWTTYAHMEIPAGYEETNMTLEYPSDLNLTGLFFSLNQVSLSQASITESGVKKVVNIPVSSITSNTNGFWKLTAESPNYCKEMNIYNNVTGNWVVNDEFLSGDYINITGKIYNSPLISGYIQQTQARLQIRFPNGTIWSVQTQSKYVDSSGMVYFDPIKIPNNGPNYKAGEYEAIITWNNSYSSYGLNETGLIYKKFTVIHDSVLNPDQGVFFIDNVAEDRTVNIKVSFNDLVDNSAIDFASVYTNFTGSIETFDRISPGFYLYEFNASKASPGNNTVTIFANHSLYLNKVINITVYVIKYTILTAEEYPSLNIAWNNNFTIHLNYTYKSNGIGIENADLTIEWNGEQSISSGNGLYNITLNSTLYQTNKEYNLKIKFNKIGCEVQTIIISVGINPRETDIASIFINDKDCTANKTYNIKSGELLNFKVTFNDLEASGTFIRGAIVTLNKSSEIGEIFDENPTYYNLTLNSIDLGDGTSFINIIAEKTNYTSTIILLTINVFERNTEYKIYLDGVDFTANPAITRYTNQQINLTVSYTDSITTQFISGAIVDVNGSTVSKVLVESYNNYTTAIDTSELNFGINFLTIYARKGSYEPQSITLAIQIVQIETWLNLYLNGNNKTLNPALTAHTNELINLTVSYKEIKSMLFISGATVDVNGSGVSKILGESFDNYTVMIDTNELNFGANFLTIYARKGGYEPQSITLTIQIVQIETILNLYLNGSNKTLNPALTAHTNELINLTVSYKEVKSMLFINGATVDVNGSGVSEILGESFDNYTVIIDTSKLNFGANFLTIYARKGGYEPQSIIITIQIVQIETVLNLYLDGEDKTLNPAVTTYTDRLINFTISYKEDNSKLFISGAIVDVNGSGVSEILGESFDNYTIMIDTSKLNFGANFLTIYARKVGYEPQSIIITVQIVQIETVLNLYLNGEDKTLNPALTTYTNQFVNFTVSYKEDNSKLFISGAIVDVNGSSISEILIESYNNYTIMIDTSELRLGANFLTIYARKEGYEPQSIIITVQIIQIETGVNLLLNGQDTTFLTIPIKKMLNITVNYFDIASKTAIMDATVQVLGGGLPLILEQDPDNYQYSIVINTNQLDLGGKLLTVYCNRTNYQPFSANLKIQVDRIRTNISTYTGDAVFNFKPGDNFRLKVILTDLDFNVNVLNATVTYTWDYGQGTLTDPDNDGMYEGTITNLREGTFVVTISVYAGDDYEFERFTITLNVIRSPEDTLFFQILTIVGISAAIALGGYLYVYQKILKYPRKVRNIHKYKSHLKSTKPVKLETLSRDQLIDEAYLKKLEPLEKQLKGSKFKN